MCLHILSYFPVVFPMYLPLMLLFIMTLVPELPMHKDDILGSLLCSFVVEVYGVVFLIVGEVL